MSRLHARERGTLVMPVLITVTAAAVAPDVRADPISVVVDYAKVVQVSRPADIVIVGNAAIADTTIRDNRTLIITGRSFGTTNLIVLDKDGHIVADRNVDKDVASALEKGLGYVPGGITVKYVDSIRLGPTGKFIKSLCRI